MKISVEKSCSVVFSRIVSQKEIKFLGIKFDSKLNFNILVDEIKERCNKRLNIIKILSNKKWGLNQNTLGNLYKSLVGSILDYSFPFLNSFSENNIKKLQAIQNTAVRSILKLKYDTPSNIVHHEAFNKLKLLTVSNRLFELSERYVGTGLSHSIPLVVRLVKEYKGFESRYIECPTPLSTARLACGGVLHERSPMNKKIERIKNKIVCGVYGTVVWVQDRKASYRFLNWFTEVALTTEAGEL
ncbi:RNA-directed DNA polymerase from mobile element jockey-like [Brachionus plicatilis]|uniref:RNA-directed DNA polymerase from mobile element jockey-like n=1 Tax=Brachionus plicatilis TaxID=10195 RepID=A0A3M7QMA2_BRAPC|nr:RNA-directed DNA polymerase from mobile element jockey-like [Brachionus plicatilis]